jgi:hypothetical protein
LFLLYTKLQIFIWCVLRRKAVCRHLRCEVRCCTVVELQW